MNPLAEIREQRPQSERAFQEAMKHLESLLLDGDSGREAMASALGYHREVCALHAAEISLISAGKLPENDPEN
jgi:Ser/Thr protein kinase RdoA (MazF antagonist)